MGKVADIARIREILAENLLLRHKLRLLAYKDPKHRDRKSTRLNSSHL